METVATDYGCPNAHLQTSLLLLLLLAQAQPVQSLIADLECMSVHTYRGKHNRSASELNDGPCEIRHPSSSHWVAAHQHPTHFCFADLLLSLSSAL